MNYQRYLPVFNERDGSIIVELYGREWGILAESEIRVEYEYFGSFRKRTGTTAELSFRLVLLDPPPKDLSIPDNIVLGEN